MARLAEANISRNRRNIGYILSILPSIGIFVSGVSKFFPNPPIMEQLDQLGVAQHAALIGLIEILCIVFYWIPKTSNLGFFLLCSYSGGIIVGELILGDIPLPGLIIGTMIYLGTLLRKPSLAGF